MVGVTRSGETADSLAAIREARQRGAPTLAVTNVLGSIAARECDDILYIRTGPEIGVAASETFSTQLTSLTFLLLATRHTNPNDTTIAALRNLPINVQAVLDSTQARNSS